MTPTLWGWKKTDVYKGGWRINTDVIIASSSQNRPIWADWKKGHKPQLHVTIGE